MNHYSRYIHICSLRYSSAENYSDAFFSNQINWMQSLLSPSFTDPFAQFLHSFQVILISMVNLHIENRFLRADSSKKNGGVSIFYVHIV